MENTTENTQATGNNNAANPGSQSAASEPSGTINNTAPSPAPQQQPSEPDIASMVKQELEKERAKWDKDVEERIKQEREDAANLAKMSEKEQQKELEERKRKADAEERARFEREKNVFHAERTLADKGIPTEFAEILAGKNKDETELNIDRFEKMFREAVTKASKENLRGTPPRVGGSTEVLTKPVEEMTYTEYVEYLSNK